MNGQRLVLPQDFSLLTRRRALAGSGLVLSAGAVASAADIESADTGRTRHGHGLRRRQGPARTSRPDCLAAPGDTTRCELSHQPLSRLSAPSQGVKTPFT